MPKGRERARRTKARRGGRRLRLPALGRLWLIGAVALVGFLYYKPLTTYLETRAAVSDRREEVRELRVERARLEARLTRATSLEALRREARRIGLVRPDEHLYIVKGIKAWRKAAAAAAR